MSCSVVVLIYEGFLEYINIFSHNTVTMALGTTSNNEATSYLTVAMNL